MEPPGGAAAAPTIKTFNHPEVGELVMEGRMLHLPERSDLTLVLHMPQPGTATTERIADLLAGERSPVAVVACC